MKRMSYRLFYLSWIVVFLELLTALEKYFRRHRFVSREIIVSMIKDNESLWRQNSSYREKHQCCLSTPSCLPEYSSKEEMNSMLSTYSSIRLLNDSQQEQQKNFQSKTSNTSLNLSGTIDSFSDTQLNTQTAVGKLEDDQSSNTKVFLVRSSSPCTAEPQSPSDYQVNSDDFSFEQMNSMLNESKDNFNVTSLSFLETKQRKIDHRRNKSEPVIMRNTAEDAPIKSSRKANLLESSTSTTTSNTSNESTVSRHFSFDYKRNMSKKTNSSANNLKKIIENKISHEIQQQKSSSSSSSTASTRKKKKLWYYPFQSSYRQRHEEFRKIFKDLTNDERLIVDYSCAWQKEILIQGRMYISQYSLCFYANFLKWETKLSLRFENISGMTREKTAKFIPNAIQFKTCKSEKYFFTSFATRDKTYATIFRLWQSILINQKFSSEQLWTMIRENYGNDLDMTTDDEDNYQKQPTDSALESNSPIQNIQLRHQEKAPLNEQEELDDRSSLSLIDDNPIDYSYESQDFLQMAQHTNNDNQNVILSSSGQEPEQSLMSTSMQSEPTFLSRCLCQSHLATQLIDRTYSVSVERLFDYLFGENEFVVAYHASRRIKDFSASQWKLNEKTNQRERLCTYKVGVAAVFGATTICSNETQIINSESPQSYYIIDTEVRNEGIKYADAFLVASRYCLVQVGPNRSHLKVTCEVRYLKSLMIIIKSFIEKNAMAALQDSYTDLNNRIELSTSSVKRHDAECSGRQRTTNPIPNVDREKVNQPTELPRKKHFSRKQQTIEINSSIDEQQTNSRTDDNAICPSENNTSDSGSSDWSTNGLLMPLCFVIMIVLATVNIFLYIKLNEIDRMADHLIEHNPLWSNQHSYLKQENHWSILLKRQEEYYQTKLISLHSILLSTHNALKNVTGILNELSKLGDEHDSGTPLDHLHSL